MAFLKVVDGSEIYNFPIHYFVHFYSTFWIFTCSNRGTVTEFSVGRCRAAPRCDVARASPRTQAQCVARGRASLGRGPPEAGTHAEPPRKSTLPALRPKAGARRALPPMPALPVVVRAPDRCAFPLRSSLLRVEELRL
jgi:hypothetical protein